MYILTFAVKCIISDNLSYTYVYINCKSRNIRTCSSPLAIKI